MGPKKFSAFDRNLHNSTTEYIEADKLLVVTDKTCRPFNPKTDKDFNPEEEFGIKVGSTIVLHHIVVLHEGSIKDLKQVVKTSGKRSVFKKRTSSGPTIIPATALVFNNEKALLKTSQKSSKLNIDKNNRDLEEDALHRFTKTNDKTDPKTKVKTGNNPSKETTPFQPLRRPDTRLCLCDHSVCPTVNSLKSDKKILSEQMSEIEGERIILKRKLNDADALQEDLRVKFGKLAEEYEDLTLQKNIMQSSTESNEDGEIIDLLKKLHESMENLPSQVVDQVKLELASQLTEINSDNQKTTDADKLGKKKIAEGRYIDVVDLEVAEMKTSVRMRITAVANLVLPQPLNMYSVHGPTARDPELLQFLDRPSYQQQPWSSTMKKRC